MIAGVAASFVSGITEPLEFSFMFIAPPLFLFHAVMAGLSFMLMSALGVIIGNTGGGLIDFLIWGVFQPGSRWYWVIVVGLVMAVPYYAVFKWYLTKKNLSVDVADQDAEEVPRAGGNTAQADFELAGRIVEALGGLDNILAVNNCLTRLRVDIRDMSLVQEKALKGTGAMGVVKPSETHIHVIYGPKVEKISASVREFVKS